MKHPSPVQTVQIPPPFPKTPYALFPRVNNTKTPFICTICTDLSPQTPEFAGGGQS
jgi:hypothetical protein